MKYLVDFKPETKLEKIGNQYKELSKGVEFGGFKYLNKIKVEENKTYALRVIAYKYESKKGDTLLLSDYPAESMAEFATINARYKRKDLIVAFQVVRKTADGGITIIWKKLQESKSPTIIFQKKEKLTDFKTLNN